MRSHVKRANAFTALPDHTVGTHSHQAAAIRTSYHVPAAATGAGQVLALLQLDGYDPQDIADYATANKLPRLNSPTF